MKIPNLKKILKPRWAHKPGFGMTEKYVLHKRESLQQSSAPEDSNLLKKLKIKRGDKVLAIAGYYASWASEIARLGAKVDYSDISRSIVNWTKKKYGKLFRKYICSNYELIPKKIIHKRIMEKRHETERMVGTKKSRLEVYKQMKRNWYVIKRKHYVINSSKDVKKQLDKFLQKSNL